MAEIKFPEGISVYVKNEKAPDWVGDTITIDTPKLIAWLQNQQLKVRLQICTGKTGKKYLKVDEFVPNQQAQHTAKPASSFPAIEEEIDSNDLPF